jgi:ABC-type polysaccharide/polyol phosphate transport system ATPase subunit
MPLASSYGTHLGVVGHNGAGKTILLRVFTGICEPARGAVRVEGQIAPLFDITLGMDSESTGYDSSPLPRSLRVRLRAGAVGCRCLQGLGLCGNDAG